MTKKINNGKKIQKKKSAKNGLSNEEKSLLLTPNEEMFVFYLLEGDSRRRAYKKAYPNCNAADNVIDVKAYKVFNRDKVRIRYNTLRKEIARERLDEAIIKGRKAQKAIEEIAYGSKTFSDYYKGEKFQREPNISERLRALSELSKDYNEIIKAEAVAEAQSSDDKIDLKIEVIE